MKKVILFLCLVLSSLMASAQDTPELVCSVATIAARSIDATSTNISWNATGAASYTLEYRSCSVTAWTTVNNLTTGTSTSDKGEYIIRNLTSCQCYVVRLRANCSANEVSDWKTSEFHTTGCVEPCRAPSGLFAAPRETMASLNWSPGVAGSVYTVQWKVASSADWKTQTATTNSLIINDLLPCNIYEFRVKSSCTNAALSEFSTSAKFKTSGCVAPCSTPRELRAVVASDRSNASVVWASTGARAYEVMYTAGDSPAQTVTVTTNTLRLANVESCKTYKFKVRSICSSATSTSAVYSEWSADISVHTEGCPRCLAPSRLSVVATDGGASLKWDAVAGNISYDIQWMGPNDTEWHTVAGVRENTYRLTGLATCSWYAYRVKANCTTTSSSVWSVPMRFKTLGCAAVCAVPRDIRVSVSDATAVISWIGATNVAANYKLLVVSEDGSFTREAAVSGNTYTITGLALCKKYKVQVKTVCSNTSVSEIVTATFETRGCTTNCERVTVLGSEVVNDTEVSIKFNFIAGQSYTVQYRVAGTAAWTSKVLSAVTANNFPVRITGLLKCTNYEWRVLRNCTATSLSESEVQKFKTTGCDAVCTAPRDVRVSVTGETAVVGWAGAANVVGNYKLLLVSADGTITRDASVTGNTFTFTGLALCKKYKVQVKTVCSITSVSEIVTAEFETLGCQTTCERTIGLASDIINDTEVAVKFNFIAGQSYTVQYRVAGTAAWTSKVLSAVTANNFPVRITGLLKCTYYEWRVLRNCTATSLSESEVQKFKTTGCDAVCAAPRDVRISVTDASAVISWIGATNVAASFKLLVVSEDGSFTRDAAVSGNTYTLTGLPLCKKYKVQIKSVCSTTSVSEIVTATFETLGCPTTCERTIGLASEVINNTEVAVKFNFIAGQYYTVQYRIAGTSVWTSIVLTSVTANSFPVRITGLVKCTTYQWRVLRNCSSTSLSESEALTFITKGCLSIEPATTQFNDKTKYISEFGIYPNPGSDFVQVAYKLENEANVKLELMNLQGQIVSRFDGGNQEAGNYMQTLDNLSNINTGIYLVVIRANGKVVDTQKWQKQ